MTRRTAVGLLSALVLNAAGESAPPESDDIFYDDDGLIVHHDSMGRNDGGDTAQREGWYWLGVWIRQNTPSLPNWSPPRQLTFNQVLDLLEPHHDGVFYRHPKQPPWNDPFSKKAGTSRDQLVPLVAAMGLWGQTDRLLRLWNALPQDALGKHAFNGDWRKILGQKLFTGDLLGPEYINLFLRAFNRNPMLANAELVAAGAGIRHGAAGEAELLANTHLRIAAGHKDRDSTGPDLNHIVALLLARLRWPTPISHSAVHEYAVQRPHSYGSYLEAYRSHYGTDMNHVRARMDAGIAHGWRPEVPAPVGVVRWYHRAEVGANAALARLYEPILVSLLT